MTRFRREGHWRIGQFGHDHWVEGHWVDRETWEDREWNSWVTGRKWTRSRLEGGVPNARCPRCGEPVWFYRNRNGGCAYFDELGKPWPKHPCMNSRSVSDRTASWQAKVMYLEELEIEDPNEFQDIRTAFAHWQSKLRILNGRAWAWEIDEASVAVQEAMAVMTKLSQRETSASFRKKRERWMGARVVVNGLEAAYEAAKEQVRAAREDYVRLLDEHS